MHGEVFPGEGKKVPGDLLCCLVARWPVARKEGNRKNYAETAEELQGTQRHRRWRRWTGRPTLKNQGWGNASA